MVGADSRNVSRVLRYSGTPQGLLRFRSRVCHPLWIRFPNRLTYRRRSHQGSYNPGTKGPGLGYSAFARRYLRNHIRFLFLRLLRCFTSPGIAYPSLFYSGWNDSILLKPGYPIRKSPGHSLCAAIRSLSQLITSFIACWHQGIHSMPLTA